MAIRNNPNQQPDPTFRVPDVVPRSAGATVTIGEFFDLLRRRLGSLLLVLAVTLLAAFGLLSTATKTFQAKAYVKVAPVVSSGDTGAAKDISTITESRVVTSTSVADLAAKSLNYTGSVSALLGHVAVNSPLDSQILIITFTSENAAKAADGANAFANAYLTYRKSVGDDLLKARLTVLNSQIAALTKQLKALGTSGSSASRTALQSQIDSLNNQVNGYQTTVVDPGQVVGVAHAPSSPSSPKALLYVAGGLLFGLVIGITVAIIRDRRDDKIHGPSDLEHSIGAPVLATVPSSAVTGGTQQQPLASLPMSAVNPAEADAYRTIATKLGTPVTGKGARSFLVLRGGSVKEELAPVNLAATFARQGLTTALVGTESALRHIRQLLGPEPDAAPLPSGLADVPGVAGLRLFSLGDEVRLDATLRHGGELIDGILDDVDIVLLDGVNLDLSSSSLTLGRLTHAAVVVGIDGKTTHAELARSVRELAQVGTSPLGGILFVRRGRLPLLGRLRRKRKTG